MKLKYKNIVKGAYVKSELTGNKHKNKDVEVSSSMWYLQCLASFVNEGKISVQAFNNCFEDAISD